MNKYVLFLFLTLSLASCKILVPAGDEQVSRYDVNASLDVPEDVATDDLIGPYKKQLDAKMNEVIGTAAKELTKELPECTLGNWAADAVYTECNKHFKKPIDFAVVNYGGIRIPSMPKGDVTVGRIFELMPFDNMMVVLAVKGSVIQQLFESVAARGGWPVSGQVRCVFSAEGKLKSLTIGGKEIDPDRVYQVGMTDYVANGGDKCTFFKDIPQYNTGVLFRDAFINYIRDQTRNDKLLDANIEGRMVME